MSPVLILLLIVICFWSLTISFKAIYFILTKEFKGSKLVWVLIVMIAIIGPVIWIVRGKKLIKN